MAQVRRLLDVVACTSCFGGGGGAERGGKVGGAAEKPRPGKGNVTEKPKSLKSPPQAYSPPRVTTESGRGTIGTETVVDGEGETSGARPQLGSFYDFFSLAHLTPPVQCKRPRSATRPISSHDDICTLLHQMSDIYLLGGYFHDGLGLHKIFCSLFVNDFKPSN